MNNKLALIFMLWFAWIPFSSLGQVSEDEVIFSAMQDEMVRSMERLKMENMERPYYISYRVLQDTGIGITASFGALLISSQGKSRKVAADVRVGDYIFDNTNFSYGAGRLTIDFLILDTDYRVLRQNLWQVTDLAYKTALETITQKRSAAQIQHIEEQIDDFEKMPPEIYIVPRAPEELDRGAWEGTMRRLSALLKEYVEFDESVFTLDIDLRDHFFLNSEGRKFSFNESLISLSITIVARAQDGRKIMNGRTFFARLPEDFPDEAALAEEIKKLAEETQSLRLAEVLEDYEGPLYLTGEATAELLARVLVPNLSSSREPMWEDSFYRDPTSRSKLMRKLNRRIAADCIHAHDDPTLTHYGNAPLIGSYPVDDDGVKPEPLSIIENGVLKNYYMSRIPTKYLKHTNGHGRSRLGNIPEGRIGNLIVRADNGLPLEDLRRQFLQLCREEGLEYGIMVTRLSNSEIENTAASMGFSSGYASYREDNLMPILAYKVYVKDGREELIRGVEIVGVKARILKDILFAGDDAYVYNFKDYGKSGNVPASIVAPAIILEEVEIQKIADEPMKPPILSNPYE